MAFSLILITLIKRYLSPIAVTVLNDSRKETTGSRTRTREKATRVAVEKLGVS